MIVHNETAGVIHRVLVLNSCVFHSIHRFLRFLTTVLAPAALGDMTSSGAVRTRHLVR